MAELMCVGLIFLAFYLGWREGRKGGEATPPPRIQRGRRTPPQIPIREIRDGPRVARPATAQQEGPIIIRPVRRPYWEQRHWQPRGNRLRGFYQTPHGSFQGYVDNWRSRNPVFYIIKPPPQLRHHPHWACFRKRGANLFWIHFAEQPPDPDAGILEMEKVLAEALANR